MKDRKEWTLMFYFASDNPLAPGIVSQLKAIKDAGFHRQVNVIAHFDPHTPLTPTHILDVNYVEKLKAKEDYRIGFVANDPYVRTLVGDKLWSTEEGSDGRLIRDRLKKELGDDYDPPQPIFRQRNDNKSERVIKKEATTNQPQMEANPTRSLKDFLDFCAEKYPAKHYMLFLLGHGIVVGNDLFLYDEHSDQEHALKLKDLNKILRGFVGQTKKYGEFELLSFHSCSMSSLEVAYELGGTEELADTKELVRTAKYMLASQGPAFVGSWPYRQILIRVFNDVKDDLEGEAKLDVDEVVRKIYAYCLYNSYDYQLAGYSFDVSLIDLRRVRDDQGIKGALVGLSDALSEGLTGPAVDLARDLIVLSHLEAQSYYEENFTDLCDFCFCLYRRCVATEKAFRDHLPKTVQAIKDECLKVLYAFGHEKPYPGEDDERNQQHLSNGRIRPNNNRISPIIRTGFTGPANQYSHGLSVYFPWSRPRDNEMWNTQYDQYALSQITDNCWRNFLNKYFDATTRRTQGDEKREARWYVRELNTYARLLEDVSGLMFNEAGQLKDTKTDPTGGDSCVCPSIKNYPTTTQAPANQKLFGGHERQG